MIGDLLEVSRLRAGKLEFRTVAVDVQAVIDDVLHTLGPTAEAAGAVLSGVSNPLLPHARAAPERLREVLLNLVENGIQHTPRGGTVSVSCLSGTDVVQVDVQDSGVGIAAEALARVFEPFFQQRHDDGDGRCGLGLGLYLVRQLVEAQGGRVAVASRQGLGSTFSFTLPTDGAAAPSSSYGPSGKEG